ncbi:UTP-hexose-1-phosphate uridylyltransferase [Ruminococcaceae bacterium KH2T8]|nr:UTP-hexose-1-phosphate uridylyltransferase [Ruminococcaceae bacterium KH2T8]
MVTNKNIMKYLTELTNYAVRCGLTDENDRTYVINSLLSALNLKEYAAPDEPLPERDLHLILEDIINWALEAGVLTSDSTASKDLFDTKIMGILTPPPSVVINKFNSLYAESPKTATDWYYGFSKSSNYIRTDRIAKDIKWSTPTEYGDIDITINLSKPEKDPRDIAAAGKAKSTSYPKCLLCPENEGFEGTLTHPARQNHRIIPITLEGDPYCLQYSPYVYYNEHCIILNKEHIPMTIDKATFAKLLSFTEVFPHYTAGSNADIPIVGGSILSHDHFQGGCYEFPMARAPYEEMFTIDGYEDITAGTIRWPMSVIRLQGSDRERLADCADHILTCWKAYTDEDAFIYAYTDDGVRHNAITPIARRTSDGRFELDLVLRNNITTDEHPLGVYHPHAEYHHLKKENIGLIEVMGLAILPARLKGEISELTDAILNGSDISSIENIAKHADWVNEWRDKYDLSTREKVESAIRDEIAIAFAGILGCAGVYKRTPEGRKAFQKFLKNL